MHTDMESRKKITTEYMGRPVHVEVDRPIGYQHGDSIYPINYGYIPGIIAGDGEEQDIYILGVSEPVAEFDGVVLAAICRKDARDVFVLPAYAQLCCASSVHVRIDEQFLARGERCERC